MRKNSVGAKKKKDKALSSKCSVKTKTKLSQNF
jgi:hypothetical protein